MNWRYAICEGEPLATYDTPEKSPDQPHDWDPLEPRVQRDPIAAYDDLRARCPVAHTDRWGGFWALTRYVDVVSVAADSDTFITSVQNLVPASPRSGVPRRPLQVDPPEHAHFRRAMNPYFEAERVAVLEPELRATARQFLAPALAAGHVEMMDAYARNLPIRAICAFLRVPEADADWIQQRTNRYVVAVSQDDAPGAQQLSGELDDYAQRLVTARQRAPLDARFDIVTGLLGSTIFGKPIAAEVVAGFIRGLLVAGDRSTSNGIGSAIWHMAQHPELQQRLRTDPALLPDAVEEFVRLYAPSHATARTATRDTDVGQQRVRMGEVVAMVFLAANHDPDVFTDPHAFSLERVPNRHIGFGHGVHKCGGQSLARLQLRVALQELLAHTAHFELDGPVDFNTWPEYGPKTLPICLEAS